MLTLPGIAVAPGIAIGEALLLASDRIDSLRQTVPPTALAAESERLRDALRFVADAVEARKQTAATELGEQYAAIFAAHAEILRDERLRKEMEAVVVQENASAEWAVRTVLQRFARLFQSLESSYLAERSGDFLDLEQRLLRRLAGDSRDRLAALDREVVLLAEDLSPSEAASLDREHVLGFATSLGGPGGHTAIVAEALDLPALVGVGPFFDSVASGDCVIVDGNAGQLIIQPDDETLDRYRRLQEKQRDRGTLLRMLDEQVAETLDGLRIHLAANIEFPDEVDAAVQRGADGIGLYRTEFLYLASDVEPDEQAHYEAYCRVIQAMRGRPVVIRTLDLGADKLGRLPDPSSERNPFLGLRSIRLSLRNLPLFRTQLRAILRASVLGDVRIMFPLISTAYELRQAKMVLNDVVEDLQEEGLPIAAVAPVGMMVEVPSAVVMLDVLAPEVDFVSIGTNDLTQYTLACDRSNREVANLYHATDPSVLRLIEMTVSTCRRSNTDVSVCGQMGSEGAEALLLIGLGLRSLSVPPPALAVLKQTIRGVTSEACRDIAARAMQMDNARDVNHFLKDSLRTLVPEVAAY